MVKGIKDADTILDDTSKKEIRSRIEQSREVLIKIKNLFTTGELNLELCIKHLKCYVL